MSTRYSRRYGATAWLIGAAVLLALALAVTWMLFAGRRPGEERRLSPMPSVTNDLAASSVLPKLMQDVRAVERASSQLVRGVVLLPDGQPAASATVTLYRLLTGWPEWQREHVDQAYTREDGAFQFRCPHLHGYLLRFEHPGYAGDEVEVSLHGDAMQLMLRPGFEISGTVLNDVGAPVPKARVSIESALGGSRRARSTQTSADGRYSFRNLAAGPAELVARHEFWPPATATALVIGDRLRTDFRFERPSLSPLHGRVLCAATQEPIAGASVELLPVRHSLGLVETVRTTTAADGTFRLSGLPRGSMRLWVRHPDFGNSMETQTIGSIAKDLTIELPERVIVAGQLSAAEDGAFVGGEILEVQDDGRELAYAVVQPDGSFEFDRRLSPGFADFRVVGGAFMFQNLQGTSARVLLEEQQRGGKSKLFLDVLKCTVVRGRLVGTNQQPLSDVRLQMMTDSLRLFGAAAWQLDLGKVSDGLMQLIGERDQWLGISGPDGRFELRGRRTGPLTVRASGVGNGSRWFRMEVPAPGETTDVGDLVLQPNCSISGRVLRGGLPFVGATVVLSSDLCGSLATTNAFGEYSATDLSPGEYTVKARISGRPTGSNELKVTVLPNEPARHVDIALEAGRIVHGLVKDEQQQPLRDALVSVRGRPGEVIATNSLGAFDVELPTRDLELVVSFGDRSSQKVVPVASDQLEVTVSLPSQKTSTLVARVTGLPGRRPINGLLLRLVPQSGDDGSAVMARWIETPEGELQKVQVPSGTMQVELWCEGFAPFQQVLELKPGESHDLGAVLLMPGATLRGLVQDGDGQPVRDAMVLLGEETDLDLFLPSVRSDAAGMFTIQGVTSRSAQLVVRRSGFAVSTIPIQLPRDVLSAAPLVIKLERGATIEVVVPRSLIPDDGLVYLRRDGQLLANTVLDERGKAWFVNRSVGRYTVSLFDSELPEQAVEVKPGDELTRVQFDASSK